MKKTKLIPLFKHILILIITVASLAGCSVSPVSLKDVPSKENFSGKQLMEDGVIANGEIENLQVMIDSDFNQKGYYPNIARVVIDKPLDDTWNAALNDIAGTEEIRYLYFNRYKFNFDDELELINRKKYQELNRDWALIKFRMVNVWEVSRNNKYKEHATITIHSAEYSPEDSIEGSTGRMLFTSHPITNREALVVIHFHENGKKQTVITVLNYMFYTVLTGDGSLLYPKLGERFQAISKGNIERSIISHIVNATVRTAQPIPSGNTPKASHP